jgi:hypothetical protein
LIRREAVSRECEVARSSVSSLNCAALERGATIPDAGNWAMVEPCGRTVATIDDPLRSLSTTE